MEKGVLEKITEDQARRIYRYIKDIEAKHDKLEDWLELLFEDQYKPFINYFNQLEPFNILLPFSMMESISWFMYELPCVRWEDWYSEIDYDNVTIRVCDDEDSFVLMLKFDWFII